MHSQQRQDELRLLLKDFDKGVVADRLLKYSKSPSTGTSTLLANARPLPGSSFVEISPRTGSKKRKRLLNDDHDGWNSHGKGKRTAH